MENITLETIWKQNTLYPFLHGYRREFIVMFGYRREFILVFGYRREFILMFGY